MRGGSPIRATRISTLSALATGATQGMTAILASPKPETVGLGITQTIKNTWTTKSIENVGVVQVDRADRGFWQVLLSYA